MPLIKVTLIGEKSRTYEITPERVKRLTEELAENGSVVLNSQMLSPFEDAVMHETLEFTGILIQSPKTRERTITIGYPHSL